jgi:hypothetical protein
VAYLLIFGLGTIAGMMVRHNGAGFRQLLLQVEDRSH